MNLQRNITLFNKKILNHNKKYQIFSFFSPNYSKCHPINGVTNDKENIN